MQSNVRERIHQILFRYLGVDQSELLPEANLQEDLGADSLDVVELVMAFEEAFGLAVPDEDVAHMRTLGDIERYLEKRVEAAGPAMFRR
jgi:acyl carrier protein